jgi:hypothetical protein
MSVIAPDIAVRLRKCAHGDGDARLVAREAAIEIERLRERIAFIECGLTTMERLLAAKGRQPELKDSSALVLYFASDGERSDFVDLFKQVKPNAVARPVD